MESKSKNKNFLVNIDDIYNKLEQNLNNFKKIIDTNIKKHESKKVYSTGIGVEAIRDNFCSILRHVKSCNKKDTYYAYKLKKLYDSIQLFFKPINEENSAYKVYHFLINSKKFVSSLFASFMYVIDKINSNKERFFNENKNFNHRENIIKQSINQFKTIVIFFYITYTIDCGSKDKKCSNAQKYLDNKIKFFSGESNRNIYKKSCSNLFEVFEVEKTKEIFKDISDKVKQRLKAQKTSKLDFMGVIEISKNITEILCGKEIVFNEEKLELKLNESPKIIYSNIGTKNKKIDLSANKYLTDDEIKNTLSEISGKCKNEVRNFMITDYNKKLCYLWLDLGRIIKFKYDKDDVSGKMNCLMPTLYFFKDLVSEHQEIIKKNIDGNNVSNLKTKYGKEFAIESEFRSFLNLWISMEIYQMLCIYEK